MQYTHTQRGPISFLLLATTAALAVAAYFMRQEWQVLLILLTAAALFALLALSFHHLRIEDRGESLSVRFGPLPIFGTSIPYSTITHVEPARSSFIDGLGIHYVPARGWTFNLWGADCVLIKTPRRTIRLGTDDIAGLAAFLRAKAAASANGFA